MKTVEEKMNELRTKKPTTDDIAELLSIIGKPGEERERKIELVRSLNQVNTQGINVAVTLEGYKEF